MDVAQQQFVALGEGFMYWGFVFAFGMLCIFKLVIRLTDKLLDALDPLLFAPLRKKIALRFGGQNSTKEERR